MSIDEFKKGSWEREWDRVKICMSVKVKAQDDDRSENYNGEKRKRRCRLTPKQRPIRLHRLCSRHA